MEIFMSLRDAKTTPRNPSGYSIDPGVRTPFTWYSPTKGVGKIGQYDIGRIIRPCKHMDNLLSIKDKLAASSSKRKKKQASRLDKAISRMRRKIKHLQSEVHKKSVTFFTREFDAIIIPPLRYKSKNKKDNTKNRSQNALLATINFVNAWWLKQKN